jgi:class 3 adenylate cyclase/tetratricopeptide (TPR) repeat protein
MTCPRCRQDSPEDAAFCPGCGIRLVRSCASCGTELPAGARFCLQCGQPVGPLPRSTSPASYTPTHIVEKVLSSKSSLEGERKHVTVLFADLKASLELLADRDPEGARTLLDPVLEQMMEAVHCYEGTVNQAMGDGIMALFGAPVAHEDHAVRACYAALRMQEAVQRYSADLRRTHGVEVRIRVGLNSGDVVVRSIGSDLHVDYTAVGHTTRLAARMEQIAATGTIWLTTATLRLAEGLVQVIPLGPVPVAGLSEPTEIFELVGASAARTRLEAAAQRGLTQFVGRTTELAQLGDALDRARLGHGQVVGVVGEAGVGKSRLLRELIHSHHLNGWRVLQSASVSYGKVAAHLPVIELLRSYFAIDGRDDPGKIQEKVTGKVVTLAPTLTRIVPALLALLDAPRDDTPWWNLDPLQRRQQTVDAVKHLLLGESEIQPLAVIFEDLNWIDDETQSVLDSLIESLSAARIVLLLNYRPDYRHDWAAKTYYQRLRMDPLPPESADELLDDLLGTDVALVPLKRLLVERTGGNPLYLEESVRALVETAALAGERGAYQLTRPVEQLTIPATVNAILAARIDRLDPEAKRILQTAAVIGKDVPMPLLLAVAETAEHDVRAALAQLQAAEFLYEVRLFPDLEFTFKHALTHEVAYQGLLGARRRALHARIVAAIEQLSSERVAEQSERLAHHALRGELWEKAAAYLRQAGLRAIARAANGEAIGYLEEALGALRRLPETRATTELTIDVRLDLRNALLPLGDRVRMGEHLYEAEVLARKLATAHRLARIITFSVIQGLDTGDYNKALKLGPEALSLARSLGDRSIEVLATTFLGLTHAARGEFREAATLLERNVALDGDLRYERFGAPAIQSALSGAYLANMLSQLGRFDAAIEQAEAAVRIAETADHPYTLHFGLIPLGLAYFRRGDLPRAIRVLERALNVCRTSQIVVGIPRAAATLGAAYAFAGRADEAVPLVASAVEESRRRETHSWPALVLLFSGMAYLGVGRIDEAAGLTREAVSLSRRLGARPAEAHALCLAGDVAAAGGAEDAEGYYREALTLAGELALRPRIAHCHLGLGKLYRRTSKGHEAHKHLTAATTMYHEMGMRSWQQQADAEMRLLA